MDDRVQDVINGLAGHVGLLDAAMKLSARDLIFLAVPLVLALWFWPVEPAERALNQRLALATTLGCLLALGAASLVAGFHSQVRPFVSDGSTRLLIRHSADNGFPSDHTAFAFAFGAAIVPWRRVAGAWYLLAAVVVAVARVYVGVHWPSDVIAGAVIGGAAGAIAACTVPLWTTPQRWLSRWLPALLLSPP